MVDKHLIEEAYYLIAVGPETVKELGYKSMGIVFVIHYSPISSICTTTFTVCAYAHPFVVWTLIYL